MNDEEVKMKEYYKTDNELVKQVVDYFLPQIGNRLIRKEFEIDGRTWLCHQTGYERNNDGSTPEDRRIEGEVILTQKDGTRHPSIRLDITVDHGF